MAFLKLFTGKSQADPPSVKLQSLSDNLLYSGVIV
jgi:hypothetical protein